MDTKEVILKDINVSNRENEVLSPRSLKKPSNFDNTEVSRFTNDNVHGQNVNLTCNGVFVDVISDNWCITVSSWSDVRVAKKATVSNGNAHISDVIRPILYFYFH